MPRPPKDRVVECMPEVELFKPAGIPLEKLQEITISVEELEAIRLKDLEGLDQEVCAERMHVSRATFQRILINARLAIARSLIEGAALRIQGGNYRMAPRSFRCTECGHAFVHTPDAGKDVLPTTCPSCGQDAVVAAERGRRGRHRHRHRGHDC